MMRHIASGLFVVVFAFGGFVVRVAAAQSTGGRQVNATGTATITAQPELLRVAITIRSEGPDVKAALAKHAGDKQAALAKLQKLSIADDAVTFAAAAVGDAPLSAQQQQMQMMMNMRGGGKKPTTTPSAVAVSSVLAAEVPLTAAAPDELLVAATE